ncbi:MAG: nuclear transport factor 2 family protein [Gemmatimonadaceae bacterium]
MHVTLKPAVLLLVSAGSLAAQSTTSAAAEREAVRRAALDYVEGFYEGDSTKLMRSIRPEVYKYGFFIPRGSAQYKGEQMPWPEFLSYARNIKTSGRTASATAPKDIQLLDVVDQTASVKLTAFWGIDYLLMGKFDGTWMITHVLWQSRPRPPSP